VNRKAICYQNNKRRKEDKIITSWKKKNDLERQTKKLNLNGLLIEMTKISKHCLRTCQREEIKHIQKKHVL